jgi:hypothetical protein
MSNPTETPHDLPEPGEREPLPPPEPVRSVVRRSYGAAALALALALIVIGGIVAAAPWWAPLLPWGPQAAREAALASRLDRLDATERQAAQHFAQQLQAANATAQKLDQRIAALETKPAATPPESPQLRQQLAQMQNQAGDLATRLAAVENAARQPSPALGALAQRVAAVESAVKQREGALAGLETRVAALDSTINSRAVAATGLERRVAALESALKQRTGAAADLDKRVAALAAQVRGRAASASVDAELGFALMRISDAVAAGRPFATEYAALAGLARGTPALKQEAAPLAAAAQTGVPSRALLEKGLRGVAAQLAAASPASAAAGDGWAAQAWQGLRGLVRVRRAGQLPAGPEGVVATAEQALAAGDLKGAVEDVGRLKLTGPPAEAAAIWLRSARQRLAAEAALNRLDTTLTERLGTGNPNAGPNPAPSPTAAGGGPPG